MIRCPKQLPWTRGGGDVSAQAAKAGQIGLPSRSTRAEKSLGVGFGPSSLAETCIAGRFLYG